VKPDAPTPQLFSVFFPSLSRTIVWKAGAVSRVRFAAHKPRALDTAPAFQDKILPARKRREGVATGKAAASKRGGFKRPSQIQPQRPRRALAYCGQKMVLTMGSTLSKQEATESNSSPHSPFISFLCWLDLICRVKTPESRTNLRALRRKGRPNSCPTDGGTMPDPCAPPQ